MSEFVTQIRNLIGSAPAGYEWLEYLLVGVILVLLLDSAISLVASVFKVIGGR